MEHVENITDVTQLINAAIEMQSRGMYLKARGLFAKAVAIDPTHPDVMLFFRMRTKRTDEHGEYYEEPEVSCCCCPCGSMNICDCLCHAAICDACCIPGGCCAFG
ncbi:MAG: hypothetical protein ABIG42_11545 [bacterium]